MQGRTRQCGQVIDTVHRTGQGQRPALQFQQACVRQTSTDHHAAATDPQGPAIAQQRLETGRALRCINQSLILHRHSERCLLVDSSGRADRLVSPHCERRPRSAADPPIPTHAHCASARQSRRSGQMQRGRAVIASQPDHTVISVHTTGDDQLRRRTAVHPQRQRITRRHTQGIVPVELSSRCKDPEDPRTGILPQHARQRNITLKLHKARGIIRGPQTPARDRAIDNLHDASIRDDRPTRIRNRRRGQLQGRTRQCGQVIYTIHGTGQGQRPALQFQHACVRQTRTDYRVTALNPQGPTVTQQRLEPSRVLRGLDQTVVLNRHREHRIVAVTAPRADRLPRSHGERRPRRPGDPPIPTRDHRAAARKGRRTCQPQRGRAVIAPQPEHTVIRIHSAGKNQLRRRTAVHPQRQRVTRRQTRGIVAVELSGRRKNPEDPRTGVLPQDTGQRDVTLKLHEARGVIRGSQTTPRDRAIDNLYYAPIRDDRPARIRNYCRRQLQCRTRPCRQVIDAIHRTSQCQRAA